MLIFAAPIIRKYSAPLLSLPVIISLGAFVTVCLLPWFFAYASGSFWLKENYFIEQPKVVQTNAYIIELLGTKANNLPFVLTWSSNETYNQVANAFSRAPVAKFWMQDLNNDGINDEFNFEISMPMLSTENIFSARVAFEINVQLSSVFRLEMYSLVITDSTFPVSSQSLDIYGDLILSARSSSYFKAYTDSIQYNYRVLNFTSVLGISPDPLSWNNIIRDYHDRDVQTLIHNSHQVWTPSKGSSPFKIKGNFKIPVNRVFYTPGAAEVLKNGWIQYLAYLILVFIIVYGCLWFLFHHQIVSTFIMNPITDSTPEEASALKSLIY